MVKVDNMKRKNLINYAIIIVGVGLISYMYNLSDFANQKVNDE